MARSVAAGFLRASTDEFAWVLRRNHVRLRTPFTMMPSAMVTFEAETLIEWAEQDADAPTYARAGEDDTMVFPDSWGASLRKAVTLWCDALRAPRWVAFALKGSGERTLFVAGLNTADGGFVIADDGTDVRVAAVENAEVAAELAHACLGRCGHFSFSRVDVTPQMVRRAGSEPTLASLLGAAGLSGREITTMQAIEKSVQETGLFGVQGSWHERWSIAPTGGSWWESPYGGVLSVKAPDGRTTLEPLTETSLARAVIHAVSLAQSLEADELVAL